jgi:hypothetical protein
MKMNIEMNITDETYPDTVSIEFNVDTHLGNYGYTKHLPSEPFWSNFELAMGAMVGEVKQMVTQSEEMNYVRH